MTAKQYGSQSMVAALKRVVVRKPDSAFGNADPLRWHYTAQPEIEEAVNEHNDFVSMLEQAGVEVIYHQEELSDHADAIFVHDPVIVSNRGAILLKMGKELRRGEPEAIGKSLEKYGVPIHYQMHGEALAEGGDLLWLDQDTLAVGQGYRTNAIGLQQLQESMPEVNCLPVQLPYYLGPEACLHLMSFISMVDNDIAVVYLPLIPVPFLQELESRKIKIVEVPDSEFDSMGPNVLAISPGQCLMLAGNPITKNRLSAAGCEVATYTGNEISLKAEGGATCLTRPIWRSDN
ncbi:MAG: arginine deiminase family protein [Chloroflexota bacterium]